MVFRRAKQRNPGVVLAMLPPHDFNWQRLIPITRQEFQKSYHDTVKNDARANEKRADKLRTKSNNTHRVVPLDEQASDKPLEDERVVRNRTQPREDMFDASITHTEALDLDRIATFSIWSNKRRLWKKLLKRIHSRYNAVSSEKITLNPEHPEFSLAVAFCLIFDIKLLPPSAKLWDALAKQLRRSIDAPGLLIAVLLGWRPDGGLADEVEKELDRLNRKASKARKVLECAIYQSVHKTIDTLYSFLLFLLDLKDCANDDPVKYWTDVVFQYFVDSAAFCSLSVDGSIESPVNSALKQRLFGWDPASLTFWNFVRRAVAGSCTSPPMPVGIASGILGNLFGERYGLKVVNLAHYVCPEGHVQWVDRTKCTKCGCPLDSQTKIIVKDCLILDEPGKGFHFAICWKCEHCGGCHKFDLGEDGEPRMPSGNKTKCPNCGILARVDKRFPTVVCFYEYVPPAIPGGGLVTLDPAAASTKALVARLKDAAFKARLESELREVTALVYRALERVVSSFQRARELDNDSESIDDHLKRMYSEVAAADELKQYHLSPDDVRGHFKTICDIMSQMVQDDIRQRDEPEDRPEDADETEADP